MVKFVFEKNSPKIRHNTQEEYVILFQKKRETSSRVTIYTSEGVSERACSSSSSLSSSLSLSFSKIIILRRQMHIKPHLIASLERLGTSNLFSLS